jgi:MoxR-like ATPase
MMQMQQKVHPIDTLAQAVDGARLPELQGRVRAIHVADGIRRYILDLITATRGHAALALGASPRGSLALLRCSQANAALAGRGFVIPDDVKHVAPACLVHRMMVNPENALGGESTTGVIEQLLRDVPVPVMP